MSVKACVVPAGALDSNDLYQMYGVFSSYYEGVSREQFLKDLAEKNDVIVLRGPKGQVCGFSTLVWKRMKVDGREVIGVFSGDTILEKAYWGSPALGLRFLVYLWMLKAKHPKIPVYWFLISKGYKTYLLMANNFATHYPNVAASTPTFEQRLMDEFYSGKFGDSYNRSSGIIRFGENACRLKNGVAPITDELRASVPKIDFFATVNPGWDKGDELACVARMTLDMPLRYFLKKVVHGKRSTKRGVLTKYARAKVGGAT